MLFLVIIIVPLQELVYKKGTNDGCHNHPPTQIIYRKIIYRYNHIIQKVNVSPSRKIFLANLRLKHFNENPITTTKNVSSPEIMMIKILIIKKKKVISKKQMRRSSLSIIISSSSSSQLYSRKYGSSGEISCSLNRLKPYKIFTYFMLSRTYRYIIYI